MCVTRADVARKRQAGSVITAAVAMQVHTHRRCQLLPAPASGAAQCAANPAAKAANTALQAA
ncbi:hypothetical protein, partial [Xanthomonas vasicola]|uniref:hypothetical protein n=1 Tax=Xanthomonas vasicola TaxID=56459 RepID=UPI0038A30667